MKAALVLAAAILVVFVSGCTVVNTTTGGADAVNKCISKCADMASTNINIAHGPCLDDRLMEGWVCDMAHDPREPEDDDPANQCPSYGGPASHFVEVNENCRLLRVA